NRCTSEDRRVALQRPCSQQEPASLQRASAFKRSKTSIKRTNVLQGTTIQSRALKYCGTVRLRITLRHSGAEKDENYDADRHQQDDSSHGDGELRRPL